MAKFHDLNGLTYYSQRLYNYLKGKFKKVGDDISLLSQKVDDNKTELSGKITKNTEDIATNAQAIQDVDDRVDALDIKVDNIVLTPIDYADGNAVNINKVEEYTFSNLSAGDIVEIPNKTGQTDYMIECYTDVGAQPEIVHNVTNINDTTTSQFVYDPRFIDVSATGAKPKDTVVLNYVKTQETIGSVTYTYYVSDVVPEEVLYNLNTITSLEES
jgi:hypothetical protein